MANLCTAPGAVWPRRGNLGWIVWLVLTMTALLASVPASADKGSQMPAVVPKAYTQECAACHLAYPPGMLSRASWGRIMGSLDRHYGSDASLDPAALQALSAWLNTHAHTYKRVTEASPEDRITRSPWFERKHRKIDDSVWKLPSVKSAAHCAACHTHAEQGRFGDGELRLPAGLSAAQQRAFRD